MFIDLGGTVRAQTAKDTLARLNPLLSIFGITRVAAQEGLGDVKIPVSVCFRPNGRLLSTTQGKGITRDLADVSAIMEAIEMFHAERLPPADLIESVSSLRKSGKSFIDPAALSMLPYQSLYTENDPIGWLFLNRLTDEQPILVPRAYLDLNRAVPPAEISTMALDASSNGLASGNTLDEALIHGLYELIERHCITEYMKLDVAARKARTLDLATIQSVPHIEELMKRIDEGGLNLAVRTIHGPLGMPAYKVFVQARDPISRTAGNVGFGAHYLPEVALSRAITEAIQSRVTEITGTRDDFFPWQYLHLDPAAAEYLPAGESTPSGKLDWRDAPRAPEFSSFAEVLQWTLELLKRHGFKDTCFFDHRRPEFGGIPVVSVVSPDLLFDRKLLHGDDRG